MATTDIKKAIVIGCPGSGKSTFARALAEKTGLPLIHLDMLYWNADKTTVAKEVFLERLRAAMSRDEWIIDGNYGGTMEMRLSACDTVYFLDYPVDICLEGIRERRGKPRSDMPWVEENDDAEFINFIKDFNSVSKPKILNLLEKYNEKDIFIFKSREEADTFLSAIKQ